MRILLLGECSNLHWTLAEGLRILGHDVTVASDGSRWMKNHRDISLIRDGYDLKSTIKFLFDVYKNFKSFKEYDIVQIKNPVFTDLKVEKNLTLYRYLKRHNKRVFLGAFGTDYCSVEASRDRKILRYSEYHVNNVSNNFELPEKLAKIWLDPAHKSVNEEIANTCDGIIACLYEYYMSYKDSYSDKLVYIPEPINLSEFKFSERHLDKEKINFFIGIQKDRSQLKGTDILYEVLQNVNRAYPTQSSIQKAESVPYNQYVSMMDNSDVLLDQLYCYTPTMNSLTAMAKGLLIVGGGEPEGYEILNEYENRPIVNVIPDKDDIFNKLEDLIINREDNAERSINSRKFVEDHHDHIQVAKQYLNFWTR